MQISAAPTVKTTDKLYSFLSIYEIAYSIVHVKERKICMDLRSLPPATTIQLNSSLLKYGSRMAKRDTVNYKNK